MKKLLLFALSLGIGTMSIAQALISVDEIIEPTTVYVGDSSPTNTIKVNMTNNGTQDYLASAGYVVWFIVTLDGTPIVDPTGGDWKLQITFDFMHGATNELILGQSWVPTQSAGNDYELCISLKSIYTTTDPQINNDPNKEKCELLAFDNPVGVEDLDITEISKITNTDGVMTVFVKNAGQQAQINIMSITGQIVKTFVPSIGGQSFEENIDVSDLTAGVYIVTIQTENGISAAQKVFIQ